MTPAAEPPRRHRAARWARSLGWPLALVAAGLAHAMALALPLNGQPLWWLQLVALAALAWRVEAQARAGDRAWRGFAAGLWFGTAWLAGTFWWLFISMHTYGGLPAALASAGVLALAAFLSLYLAAAMALYVARGPAGAGARAVLFAALFLLAELARGQWLTGFPWGAAGYAHVDGPLAAHAPWVGVYGMGALAAWLAMTLAQWSRCSRWRGLIVMAVIALPWVARMGDDGGLHTRSAGMIDVALLQGNIPQDEKFQPGTGVPMALKWYAEQLREPLASLIVAPETAIPLLPQQLQPAYRQALVEPFTHFDRAALVGMPMGDFERGYTNSAVGFRPGADPYRYDKHHLVPFGEFIPPLFRWFTQMMNIPLGDFSRGPDRPPPFEWKGQRLAPTICYEDLFGEELARRFADGTQAPTVMVNLSNIAWFGDSVAIDQHLHISRLRALEFERPMIRATNTGATVIIDHRGVVTHALPRLERGVLRGTVEGRDGLTPYARWASALGLWPLWVLGLLLTLTLGRRAPAARGAGAIGPAP